MEDEKSVTETKEREYNAIYDKLVEDDLDFTGMVAYALYKKEKKEYLEKIKEKKGKVTDEDISNFHIASEVRLDGYTQEAILYVREFVNDVIENQTKVSIDSITEIVESKAGPKGFANWMRVITQNIIAAFIYTIIISTLLFFVWFKKSGNEEKAKQDFEKSVISVVGRPQDSTIID